MKILFVLSLGFDRPGPSVHLLSAIMEELTSRGHLIHVIEEHTGGPDPDLPDRLNATGLVTCEAIHMRPPAKDNFAGRYLHRLAYAREAGLRMRAHPDADAVYIHSCQALRPLARAARKYIPRAKLVVNVQDIFPQNAAAIGALLEGGLLYRIFASGQAKAYREADRIITLSEDMKETLCRAGAAPERIAVIPPWSYDDEISWIPPERNRFLEAYPDARGFFRVVYAGNVGQMQGVEVMLEAAERLKDIPRVLLMVVGGGARAEALKRMAGERGIDNLRFYPMQPPNLASHVYSMADINLITLAPGVTSTAFPSKTAICCAVARPIVASADPDSRYARMIAAFDNCWVTPPGDAMALSERIRACERGEIGPSRGARALWRDYLSREAGVRAHAALFEELAGKECMT